MNSFEVASHVFHIVVLTLGHSVWPEVTSTGRPTVALVALVGLLVVVVGSSVVGASVVVVGSSVVGGSVEPWIDCHWASKRFHNSAISDILMSTNTNRFLGNNTEKFQ